MGQNTSSYERDVLVPTLERDRRRLESEMTTYRGLLTQCADWMYQRLQATDADEDGKALYRSVRKWLGNRQPS